MAVDIHKMQEDITSVCEEEKCALGFGGWARHGYREGAVGNVGEGWELDVGGRDGVEKERLFPQGNVASLAIDIEKEQPSVRGGEAELVVRATAVGELERVQCWVEGGVAVEMERIMAEKGGDETGGRVGHGRWARGVAEAVGLLD